MLKATMIGLYPVLFASAVSLVLLVFSYSPAPAASPQVGQTDEKAPSDDATSDLIPAELLLELPDYVA